MAGLRQRRTLLKTRIRRLNQELEHVEGVLAADGDAEGDEGWRERILKWLEDKEAGDEVSSKELRAAYPALGPSCASTWLTRLEGEGSIRFSRYLGNGPRSGKVYRRV